MKNHSEKCDGISGCSSVKFFRNQNHLSISGCKDTKIEIKLRRELWSRGLRYRKNLATVTGKPDIVFTKKKIAVFCDSEFWHGYDWDNRKEDIKTNREYWIKKIERNIERDNEVNRSLSNEGWIVLRFWGKDIQKNLIECADIIEHNVREKK